MFGSTVYEFWSETILTTLTLPLELCYLDQHKKIGKTNFIWSLNFTSEWRLMRIVTRRAEKQIAKTSGSQDSRQRR
uniref:Uncharacterized protein n=1 Tax=Tetranychus urticae TaxID=32264 RepID=T1KVG4_TETUR